MHQYFIKTPWLVKQFFSSYIWSLPPIENAVYLTFDDGPHPSITPFVLDELKKYNALATFFCIGKNVVSFPEVYERILREDHGIGNHTHNHLNGWKVTTEAYVENATEAAKHIQSNLFRPPYGRIKRSQAKKIASTLSGGDVKIIMWDVLSADFDRTISPQQCLNNVLNNVTAGSIIVCHDSEKAFPNLKYVLPIVLEQLSKRGMVFKKIIL